MSKTILGLACAAGAGAAAMFFYLRKKKAPYKAPYKLTC